VLKLMRDSSRGVRFGAFEVDFDACELRKHGIRIGLQEQPFRLLRALLERPGQVVSRDELRRQIWLADTFVDFDRSLNTAVLKVRQALGDSSTHSRFLETIPRHGYRFVAIVEPIEPAGSVAAGELPGSQAVDRAEKGAPVTPRETSARSRICVRRRSHDRRDVADHCRPSRDQSAKSDLEDQASDKLCGCRICSRLVTRWTFRGVQSFCPGRCEYFRHAYWRRRPGAVNQRPDG
jgi:DNA-binding winged helix-turn-helix (wHTH) protein